MLVTGISLVQVGKDVPSLQSFMYLRGWEMYLPSFPYMIGSTGRSLVLIGAAFHAIDARRDTMSKRTSWRYIEHISNRYGKASLTIYFLHQAVHIWPLQIAVLLYGEDWEEEYLYDVCEPWQAVILGTLFFSLMYPMIGWMDRHRIPRLEHAMRWLCG